MKIIDKLSSFVVFPIKYILENYGVQYPGICILTSVLYMTFPFLFIFFFSNLFYILGLIISIMGWLYLIRNGLVNIIRSLEQVDN
jgi:hypothetical protein